MPPLSRHMRSHVRRQLTMDIRPIDPGFFKDPTAFEYPCNPAAATRTIPSISLKQALPVDCFESGTDVELQFSEVRGS